MKTKNIDCYANSSRYLFCSAKASRFLSPGIHVILDPLAKLDYGDVIVCTEFKVRVHKGAAEWNDIKIGSSIIIGKIVLSEKKYVFIQGDQAACPKPPVDIDVKVVF